MRQIHLACCWTLRNQVEKSWRASHRERTYTYYSEELDSHTRGTGFLVNKNIKNSVLGCRPVSSRRICFRLRAAPFNIRIVQVYAPTSDYDQVEEFYNQMHVVIGKVDKKDIRILQGDWNAKVGTDTVKDWNTKKVTDTVKDWNTKEVTDTVKDWNTKVGTHTVKDWNTKVGTDTVKDWNTKEGTDTL